MLVDKETGEEREVDVLITVDAAPYKLFIGIEVVSGSRPADVSWVERMCAKHAALPVDKLILVSERGFTQAALTKARANCIEALTLERALATDWRLISKSEASGVFEVVTFHYECKAMCRFADGRTEQIVAPLEAPLQIGDHTLTVGDWASQLMNKPVFSDALAHLMEDASERDLRLAYRDPSGIWKLDGDGERTQIEEMRVSLRVLKVETPVELANGSYCGTPFVAGTSTDSTPLLQFVLVRRHSGAVCGRLLDRVGLRTLKSFSCP